MFYNNLFNRISSVDVLMVTPLMAQEWLQCRPFFQRDEHDAQTNLLEDAIDNEQFEPTLIRFDVYNGVRYLLDGQHRLNAIVNTGITVPLVVMTIEADSLDDMADSYCRLDNNVRRGAATAARELARRLNITKPQGRRLYQAARVINADFLEKNMPGTRVGTASVDKRLETAQYYGPEAKLFFSILENAPKEQKAALQKMGVMSVALVTLKEQPLKAKAFWRAVVARDYGPRDPETELNYLLERQVNHKVLPTMQAREIAFCWSAYYDGNGCDLFDSHWDTSQPIEIRGTKYQMSEAAYPVLAEV